MVAIVVATSNRPASPATQPGHWTDAAADAVVEALPDQRGATDTAVVPVEVDAATAVAAPPKAKVRTRVKPAAPRCDDDPYACP